ncbi:MAG TPA: hypothetical protein VE035_05690 [Puia sp.]|nr:hypothetical protein [Puia sp.]
MKSRTYIRLFFLILVTITSFLLFSYSRSAPSTCDENSDRGKCPQKKAQTDFIIWESLSRNLLSASR